MSQRFYNHKRGRYPQGRGWSDGHRSGHTYHHPSPSSSSGYESVHANPHVAHALGTLIGCVVDVVTTSGVVYEGVLRAISPNMDVALSVAHDKSKVPSSENVQNLIELKFSDVVRVSAGTENNPTSSTSGIFKTDTEISRSNGPTSSSKELKRFTDFGNTSVGLEEEGSVGWSAEEMFHTNKEKFQVTSKYDENLPQYTTELNREGEGYEDRAARARVLANEIEGNKSKHSGYDDIGTEEELFSSVTRDHKEAPPPHPTTASHLHRPSQPTSSTLTPHTNDVPSTADNSTQKSETASVNQQSTISTDDAPPLVTTATSSSSDLSSTCKEDTEGQSSPESSRSTDKTGDREQVDCDKTVSAESAPVKEAVVKVEDSKTVEEIPPTASETPPISEDTPTVEAPPPSDDGIKDKESDKPAVPKTAFKLNPNAKEFKLPVIAANLSVVTTTATPTTTAPGHTVTTTQSSTYNTPSGRRPPFKSRQPRGVTPTNLLTTQDYIIQAQGGGFVIPQGGVGMVRPVSPGQMFYPAQYQVQPGVLGATGVYTPHLQQVVTSGVTPTNPQHHMLLAHQQLMQQPQVLSQQQGLFQQPGALQPGGAMLGLHGNSPQSYQQVIYTPQGGQVYVSPQGGLPAQGGATPIVVSGSTMPLLPPQPVISGVNPTQPPGVFTPNRGSYPSHPQ